MGLLPDWQIERDIKITPFEPARSRPGVISYGVTSYGYDVRVGRKFKIFTNARCAVVDPKNFDPRSFVDIEDDYCLIPPNSFALAETVETFEIPRDVLAVCLGKSTYARCFVANTRVALVDGTAPTLEEMTSRAEGGELFWGYSVGPEGRVLVAQLEAPRYIGRDCVLEIELDNGRKICATPDHQFMRRSGEMTEAQTLRPGDSLMPFDRKAGHDTVYQPLDGTWSGTSRLADEWVVRQDCPAPSGSCSAAFKDSRSRAQLTNHKIVAIRDVPGVHDVYCLTVPEAGNFALDAGVFVHNCGIIVNVTPLEPEWRGKVTIEISNTTPLPAKIYAGEGIAQILFFRAEAVCRTSYADKKGKYQDQTGLTLPFVQGSEPPRP